ncbi:MAG: hypothetical protein AAF234_11495 [Pseudomonadota bacterium]
MQEASGFALGGVGLALLGYGLFSAFVSGPELGQRTIDAMNWSENCETAIARQAEPEPRAPAAISRGSVDVCRIAFSLYGQRGEQYCDMHGATINGGVDDLLDTAGSLVDIVEAPARAARQALAAQAAADAPNRCACAATQVLSDERLSFALYAGSARLITPPAIDTLQSQLRVALSSPYCAMEG